MSTYSDESPYELIDSAGLFDLRDGKLLRAEIDSINSAANTASITLLDTCEAMDGVSLSAVPFWFHCEFSAGTLADLAHGHMAFAVGDMVYVLYMPAAGDTLARLDIIGHVDERGTRMCRNEYIVLMLSKDGTNSTKHFTIFDVGTGATLDLTTFVNKDAGSPAKPTSFPCAYSTYSTWLAYNFTASTPGATVPVGITKKTITDYEALSSGSETTNIAGYPTVNDPAWWRYADEYSTLYLNENSYVSVSGFLGWNPVHSDGLYSNGYRRNEFTFEYTDIGWNINDGTDFSTTSIVIATRDSYVEQISFAQTGNATLSVNDSFTFTMSCSVLPFFTLNDSSSGSVSSVSCAFGGSVSIPPFTEKSWANVNTPDAIRISGYCVGANGFYTAFAVPITSVVYNGITVEGGADFSGGIIWEEALTDTDLSLDQYGAEVMTPNAISTVTLFNEVDGIDLSSSVSPILCMQNRNTAKSSGLDSTLSSLISFIHGTYSGLIDEDSFSMSAYIKQA